MKSFSTKALELALDSLKRSIVVTQQLSDKSISEDHRETLRAGVIQHFEFCYELSWKTLKRKLELGASDTALIGTMMYQEIIREGAQKGLILNAEKWFQYRKKRNLTSHTYHAKTAEEVYESAVAFYDDAMDLLHQLKNDRHD